MPALSPLHAGPAAGFCCGLPGTLGSMQPPRHVPSAHQWQHAAAGTAGAVCTTPIATSFLEGSTQVSVPCRSTAGLAAAH